MTVSDGHLEEVEREAVRAAVQKEEKGYYQEVVPLLKELSPTASADSVERAAQEIARAITKYKLELQAAPRESIKEQRRELRRKKEALEACFGAIDSESGSFAAWAAFRVAFLSTPGSLKELKKQLLCSIKAAEIALAGLEGTHKHGDWFTAELSAELASQMRSLGLRPVASSDMNTKLTPGKPAKSASLARLLRVAMELAGASPPEDLIYFMRKGFELARTRGVRVTRPIGKGGDVHVLGLEKFDSK